MIWSMLLLLSLAVIASANSKPGNNRYLVYAKESDTSVEFFKTSFKLKNLKSSMKLFEIPKENGRVLDKLYLSHKEGGDVLYWSFKGSSTIGQAILLNTPSVSSKPFGEKTDLFIGLGDMDEIYLYSPKSKIVSVYDFNTGKKKSEKDGLKDAFKPNMKCVDIDPRMREQIFFADCPGGNKKNVGKVFDVKENDVMPQYNQPLPVCFDNWRISPDAMLAYAVKGKRIYLSPVEGEPFEQYLVAEKKINGFAVANKAIFFTTEDEGKIFKATLKEKNTISSEEVNGKITKLVLYQHSIFKTQPLNTTFDTAVEEMDQ